MLIRSRAFYLLIVFVFILTPVFKAQKGYRTEYGVLLGVSNYLGEIGGREQPARPTLLDARLAQSRWAVGAFLRYRFHQKLAFKTSFNYMRIAGEDFKTIYPARKYRNLSFRNDIYDVEATLDWLFYDSKKPIGIYNRTSVYFTTYLSIGVGGFYHNPKAYYQGSWVALQPIKTEAVNYSKFQFCVPIGGGFYFTLNKRRKTRRIGLEINWRFTTTDYLDDISTVYKDPADLSSATAVALSNRNPELASQPEGMSANYGWHGVDASGEPINQAPRGGKDQNDSYLSISVSYGVAIKSNYKKSKGRRIRKTSF